MAAKLRGPRPRVGDTCWEVEWCSKLAFYNDDSNGDVDHDRCTIVIRRVPDRVAAEALARKVYPVVTETFGVVRYWPAEFVAYDSDDATRYPHAGFWEGTADAEVYEGDD